MSALLQALPSISDVHFDPDGISAWRLVLGAEAAALTEQPSSAKYRDHLVGVRVLGWFLRDFWDNPSPKFGMTPYHHVLLETKSCFRVDDVAVGSPEETKAQYEKVFALGLMYRNHLIRVFCSGPEPFTTPSRDVSRPSFDEHRQNMLLALATAPKTKQDVKKIALHRDGYKCMITGACEYEAIEKYPELYDGISMVLPTKCVHIFPESAQDNDLYGATAFNLLGMFGLKDQVHKLLGGQVNSPCNVLTLTQALHTYFDEFFFWLEPVKDKPNTYKVCARRAWFYKSTYAKEIPPYITFEVDPTVVEDCAVKGVRVPDLPDPSLMAIRASCARVACMSGAIEQSDEILRDVDSIPVLASDGTHADLLSSLLSRSFAGLEVSG